MKQIFTICFLGSLFLYAVNGHPEFAKLIPNGDNVPNPCEPGTLWKGVGHLDKDGGGNRNVFGLAFIKAGLQWTKDLCGADSDNDGRTNGEELGDPTCKWEPGQNPTTSEGITHPGIPTGQCKPI